MCKINVHSKKKLSLCYNLKDCKEKKKIEVRAAISDIFRNLQLSVMCMGRRGC